MPQRSAIVRGVALVAVLGAVLVLPPGPASADVGAHMRQTRPAPAQLADRAAEPSCANPHIATLPVECDPNYEHWDAVMAEEAAARGRTRASTSTRSPASTLTAIAYGEVEVGTAGTNDTLASAEFLAGLGTGAGDNDGADVAGSLASNADNDFYSLDLEAGDIVGLSVSGGADLVQLVEPTGTVLIDSIGDASSLYSTGSPLPGGGNAVAGYVVDTPGRHAINVDRYTGVVGSYVLEVRIFRPVLESRWFGGQVLFVDFDGATIVDRSIFSGGPAGPGTLDPLSTFLPNWGLVPADEDAVIDAIMATVEENFADIAATGKNGDNATSGVEGEYRIEIRNSRDHPDPFGAPNVSRVIVGGTIAQLGISTIGLAQSIDVGNFTPEQDSVMLLDLRSEPAGNPNSLNSVPLGPGVSIIDLIGISIGNSVAHEAGHLFGNYHTENSNFVVDVMDKGGTAVTVKPQLGSDLIFGTSDDVDRDFRLDIYAIVEGFLGVQDSKNSTAFALSTGDSSLPSVTIDQAAGQIDPTNGATVDFTVEFSEPVTDFVTGDVTLAGSAGATTATVTGSGTTYDVAVTGMTGDGTVIATIGAGVASDGVGNANTASTSTDNSVTYDATAPTVTVEQAAGQADPTNSTTVDFTVEFSEPVTSFASGDVTLTGSAGATTASVTGSGTTYNIAATGMTGDGTVVATVAASVAPDPAGNSNVASTSTDNSVSYDATGPTVTIEQAAGQADPGNGATVDFTIAFSEVVTDFATGDVTITGSAGATTASVTGSGTVYNVAVTGMTSDGAVTATVAAGVASDAVGNPNLASTSTDNTVTLDSSGPIITTPDITVDADPGRDGAIVNYVVTASDALRATSSLQIDLADRADAAAPILTPGGVTCAPASGTFFSIGTTIVTCTASDLAGNTTTSTFDVVVVDAEKPTISQPNDVAILIGAPGPTTVTFPTPATSDNSGSATVTCAPASGSVFDVGTTVVTCTSSDSAGNTSSTTFVVQVIVATSQLPATGGGLDWIRPSLQLTVLGLGLIGLSRVGRRRRWRA